MRKMDRLKKEAKESCEFRGHDLRRFKTLDYHRAVSSCKRCNRVVRVDAKPSVNDIAISGEPVALECISDDQKLISDLWSAIENGTIDDDFFDLRVRVRKSYNQWS